jgi:hypothetical protein
MGDVKKRTWFSSGGVTLRLILTRQYFKRSVGILLALILFILAVPISQVRSASSIVNNTQADQLLYIHSSGAQVQYGDFISSSTATGAVNGLNTYYSYYVEVPPGLGTLQVDIYDPDIGTDANTLNRDRQINGNSCFLYQLVTPTGTVQASALFGYAGGTCLVDGGGAGQYPLVGGSGSMTYNAAWYTLATVANPASGHWEIRVRGDNTITTGTDFNAYALRAHDGTPGAGGRELNVYAPTFVTMGVNATTNYPIGTMRSYNFYPYVTSGCTMRIADFDTDGGTYASFNLNTRLGTNVLNTATGFSGNNVWASHSVPSWTTPMTATNYGIWDMRSGVSRYTGPTENYVPHYYLNDLHSATIITPTTQPEANTFRVYLPTDAGTAPSKPYVTQQLSWVSGPNPPVINQTSVYQVQVQVVNPITSTGTITFTNTNVVSANVPGSGVTYAGNFSANLGSVVNQPIVGSTGNVTWNPGTVLTNTTATMSYRINVSTAISQTLNVTGLPTSNGTQATFVDETGNTSQPRATFTFGPLCQLSLRAYTATSVTLSSFTTTPDGVSIGATPLFAGLAIVLSVGVGWQWKRRRYTKPSRDT